MYSMSCATNYLGIFPISMQNRITNDSAVGPCQLDSPTASGGLRPKRTCPPWSRQERCPWRPEHCLRIRHPTVPCTVDRALLFLKAPSVSCPITPTVPYLKFRFRSSAEYAPQFTIPSCPTVLCYTQSPTIPYQWSQRFPMLYFGLFHVKKPSCFRTLKPPTVSDTTFKANPYPKP